MVVSNPVSQQEKAGKRKVETTTKQERNSVPQMQPVQSEYSRNNTAELGGSPQQTLPTSMVQNIPLSKGHLISEQPSSKQITGITVSQLTRNEVFKTTPVQSEYSRNNATELGGLPQQTLPTSVVQNIPPLQRGQLEKQSRLSRSVLDASLQGSSEPCLPLQTCAAPGKQGKLELLINYCIEKLETLFKRQTM